MQQSLSELLFLGYRRRVLGLLLLHPDETVLGREIARRTALPAGTLNRELARLADAGLLKRDTDSPLAAHQLAGPQLPDAGKNSGSD
jgi:DNA-binding MarR family transcriptional regulator